MSDDEDTLYTLDVIDITNAIRRTQVKNRNKGFDDILTDVANELDVEIDFPEGT